MKNHTWKVDGITCISCTNTIKSYLLKKGVSTVSVDYLSKEVSCTFEENVDIKKLEQGVENLGYKKVISNNSKHHADKHDHAHKDPENEVHNHHHGHSQPSNEKYYFLISLIFTIPFFIGMLPFFGNFHHHFLTKYVQLALVIPVFLISIYFFGISAFKSLLVGTMNMNVLIFMGASLAFFYSLYLSFFTTETMFYYETTATIITLVLAGNFIEEYTVRKTQKSIEELAKVQKIKANMLVYGADGSEQIFSIPANELKVGDLVLIHSGDTVPNDCKVLWGQALVNESLITGETIPLSKNMNDLLIGGSILEDGNIKAIITSVGKDTVLSKIISLIQKAQSEKPPIQKLADRISSIFVPTILVIAILTFILNYIFWNISLNYSLLRTITVLVIACPCAMGLATPAAVAVGLGRGAKKGILIKDASCLENIKKIKKIVFDKTGTLTTGNFVIKNFEFYQNYSQEEFQKLVYSILKYSNHPIAQSVCKFWKTENIIVFNKTNEIKGKGMIAVDKLNNSFTVGSYKLADNLSKNILDNHNIYVHCNNELIGWIDLTDEIRPEAFAVIEMLKKQGYETIVLSGDKKEVVANVATSLNIDSFYAEQSPADKLEFIKKSMLESPTMMVGDGINDAPALAEAMVGVSLATASNMSISTAQIVLMKNGLQELPMAMALGRATYRTIQTNLFWAFSYNIIAVPIAAIGLLGTYGPTYGALIMSLSDVVLVINSLYLFKKKLV